MKRAVLIHGWEGTPEDGWKPWLKSKLEAEGFEVLVPAMPDTMHPSVGPWVDQLAQTVGQPDTDTYLVGHSLGCITILRYLETLGDSAKIGGAILVAAFAEDLKASGYEGQLSSFFESPIQWAAIKSHCPKFVVFNSDNDRWVATDQLKIFEQNLGAEGHMKHAMGHFSGSEGMTELPIVYDKLISITDSKN